MADVSKVKQTDTFKTMVTRVNETIDKVNGIGVSLSDLELEVENNKTEVDEELENIGTEVTAAEMNAYLGTLYPSTSTASE